MIIHQQHCTHLQFLVFEFALQLLRLRHLAHRPVEVVLVDRISVILDRKEATMHR